MLTIFAPQRVENQIITVDSENEHLLKDAVYIDLLEPTSEEEHLVERYTGVDIPTLLEMQEIEPSNRMYIEDGSIYLIVTMVVKAESREPFTSAVSFIITSKALITVRFSEPLAFEIFKNRLIRHRQTRTTPGQLFLGLLEASIDRLADILEGITHNMDAFSQQIFRPEPDARALAEPDFKQLMQNIGANGDLSAKIRESLMSFDRIVSFVGQTYKGPGIRDFSENLNLVNRDILALVDFTNFIATKASFLLSSTLGLVNIEQNNIIKIFSVAAVIFLPPTLIASIYGMNFHHLPELQWVWGYPLSVVLMCLSAWLPYRFFKRKKWL
jgi:magnesium transporter